MCLNRYAYHLIACVPLVAGVSASAEGTVEVFVDPASTTKLVDDLFTVDLIADLGTTQIIGWGLDLTFDDSILTLEGSPTVGPFWESAFASDGDGLVGLADPFTDPDGDGTSGAVSGNGVLLATLTFTAVAPGQTDLELGFTATDLTEGFPLFTTGFGDADFVAGQVTVLPEPAGALLMVLALCGCCCRLRRSRR